MQKDVVIIGAGASGLFCAAEAGKRGKSVLLLDHAQKIGSKIRVSGGGKCNFTNLYISSEHYISQNPHFCKSALSRYSPEDFLSLLRKHKISFHEKEEGQLFCDATSSGIIETLRAECEKTDAEFLLGCSVINITHNDLFIVTTDRGVFQSRSLVIATGGLSYPKLGASDFGIRIAEQFRINVIEPRPGLVPLTFGAKEWNIFNVLSGVAIFAEVSSNRASFRGRILFTHRGLSGPPILQISSYWNKGETLSVNLLPGINVYELLRSNRQSKKEIRTLLSQFLPSRFSRVWCASYLQPRPICQFTDKELRDAAEKLLAWQVKPSGSEGYGAAEVTVGGIDTNELSSKTMETKKAPGLYVIGELLDVTGQLGGYNLHWAWASGYAAGRNV
jgi:predicted Rossmann fold flavoprotein